MKRSKKYAIKVNGKKAYNLDSDPVAVLVHRVASGEEPTTLDVSHLDAQQSHNWEQYDLADGDSQARARAIVAGFAYKSLARHLRRRAKKTSHKRTR
jgi:hypothetical protein